MPITLEDLERMETDDLYVYLGSSEASPPDDNDFENFGPNFDYRDFGHSVFKRICDQIASLICSNDDKYKEERSLINKALSGGKGVGSASVITGCIVKFGILDPTMATVVSILMTRVFIIPIGDEVCRHIKSA